MKHCPNCRRKPKQAQDPRTGESVWYCDACGWGIAGLSLDSDDDDQPQPYVPTFNDPAESSLFSGRVALYLTTGWLFTLALLILPYTLLWNHFDALPAWGHAAYWIAAAIYLAAAETTSPEYDTEEMGIAGTWINNPFSYVDDYNRLMLVFAVLLIPGKIACETIRRSWRILWPTGRDGN